MLCQESLRDPNFQTFCEECLAHFEWAPLHPQFDEMPQTKSEALKCPNIRRNLAAFYYEGSAEVLVSFYKRPNGRYLAEVMAALMVLQWLESGLPFPDLIVPAPSSPLSNLKRGFSPSFLLAEAVSKIFKRPIWKGLKQEVTFLKQSSKSEEERAKLNAGFIYVDCSTAILRDKHILLVDDVTTTGRTLHLASECLLDGYPRRIDALTFARVLKNH